MEIAVPERKVIKQDCPLCGSPADYCLVDFSKCKYFECANCGLFQISLRAEKVLLQAPQQWREGYAKRARQAPEEHALVIRVPPPSQEIGAASATLSGKFVLRSELPQ